MSKLETRRKQYGIPPIPYLPQGKNVQVFRIPDQSVSAGGIIIPDTHSEPQPVGVLVAAGLAALDIMADNLIEVGDVVWFGRFAGWEREVSRIAEGKGVKVLQMKIEDVLGSVDAVDRSSKRYRVVRDAETGEHSYVSI